MLGDNENCYTRKNSFVSENENSTYENENHINYRELEDQYSSSVKLLYEIEIVLW